jgi:hypothetical protein
MPGSTDHEQLGPHGDGGVVHARRGEDRARGVHVRDEEVRVHGDAEGVGGQVGPCPTAERI